MQVGDLVKVRRMSGLYTALVWYDRGDQKVR